MGRSVLRNLRWSRHAGQRSHRLHLSREAIGSEFEQHQQQATLPHDSARDHSPFCPVLALFAVPLGKLPRLRRSCCSASPNFAGDHHTSTHWSSSRSESSPPRRVERVGEVQLTHHDHAVRQARTRLGAAAPSKSSASSAAAARAQRRAVGGVMNDDTSRADMGTLVVEDERAACSYLVRAHAGADVGGGQVPASGDVPRFNIRFSCGPTNSPNLHCRQRYLSCTGRAQMRRSSFAP
jgi:hypothetical protein